MKLLAVSFAYPPFIAPRSIQVARLLRHLDAEVSLICGSDESEGSDRSIDADADTSIALCRRVPFARSRLRRRLDAAASRLHVPLWNERPDMYRRWLRPALAAAAAMLGTGYRPDAIVSFGNPMTDHLVALQLKRRLGVPWVAHFSDPWTDNPYHPYDPLERWVNRRLERAVMESADLLLFPSAECADYMLRAAPTGWRAKQGVLPHSFDAAAWARQLPHPRERDSLVVRHIGTLYGPRNTRPMMRALERVVSADPALIEGVRFEFVGISDSSSFGSELHRLPRGLVTTAPRVSYGESLALMARSDGLLLMDGVWEGPGIFFPAKLADYIGSGQPIFGIASPGAAAGIIRRLGGPVADVLDDAGIARELAAFLAQLRLRRRAEPAEWGDPAERSQYAAPNVARLFSGQVAALLTR